jgi:hypothetical protein
LDSGEYVLADDFTGRMIELECGKAAPARAQLYCAGPVGI